MSIRRLFLPLTFLYVTLNLSGCSLLEVKLESEAVPLTQQELNMRVLTRGYAQEFFSQVEQAADQLEKTYPPTDKVNQSYVLLWKIHAEEGLQSAAYQVSPMAALIDSWVFTYQMEQLFSEGAASDLYISDEAQRVSATLKEKIDRLGQSLLNEGSYTQTKTFVADFVDQNPFVDLRMVRTPAYRAWLKSNQMDESEAVTTMGTMPEAMADISDRLSLVSDQTPKIMTWKAQLVAINSSASFEQVNDALNSLKLTSDSLKDFIENNPEYMQQLTQQIRVQLEPLVDDIDNKTAQRLSQLSEERQALEAMVARERMEIAAIISDERALFAKDLDHLSQEVISLAMDKLIELIKSVIIYFVLFILAIFFAPLILGYMLGKRASRSSSSA